MSRRAVGLLSGTSLDGIDAAVCRIDRGSGPFGYDVTVESFVTVPYDEEARDALRRLCDGGTVDDACRMHAGLGAAFAAATADAREAAGLDPEEVAVVGSHGQTVRHLPAVESLFGLARSRSTLQLGDADVIAERTGIDTVADFRARDVAAGGHGAPLAPFLDLALLGDPDEARAAQNVGGIANCTLMPPSPSRDDVVAFDTGPGNMVIDAVVERVTDGAMTYDEDGAVAREGTVDDGLIDACLEDPYFGRAPPKTTGRADFGASYADEFVAAGRDRGLGDEDLVASATALTARSIADAYDRFADPYPDRAIVSGGGAANPVLMELLDAALRCPVERSDAHGVGHDAKEAALFALLGVAAIDGVAGNVPAATGATRPVVLGKRAPA